LKLPPPPCAVLLGSKWRFSITTFDYSRVLLKGPSFEVQPVCCLVSPVLQPKDNIPNALPPHSPTRFPQMALDFWLEPLFGWVQQQVSACSMEHVNNFTIINQEISKQSISKHNHSPNKGSLVGGFNLSEKY
jgi:hypothetical protein